MEARLDYLWCLAQTYAPTNLPLARFYLEQMRDLACEHDIDIAESVTSRFCSWCSAPFLPPLTCKARLRSVETCSRSAKCELERKRRLKMSGSGSSANSSNASSSVPLLNKGRSGDEARKHSSKQHITGKNVLAYHCVLCDHVSYFEGTLPSFNQKALLAKKTVASDPSASASASASQASAVSPADNKTPSRKAGGISTSSDKGKKRKRTPAGKKNTLKSILAQNQAKANQNAPSSLNLYSFLESLKK